MLSEIYITSSIALFIAIFGWSENIFGFSEKTTAKENMFCNKTQISIDKYKKLIALLSKEDKMDSGLFTKQLVPLLKGSKIVTTDHIVASNLKDNYRLMKLWRENNKIKKIFLGILFMFLFIVGTIMTILEISGLPNKIIWLSQLDLFIFIIIGYFIYSAIHKIENKIQKNLTTITLYIEGKDGR